MQEAVSYLHVLVPSALPSRSRSFYDRSYIVLSATSSMRRERHESVMSSVMNGKGPLTPTEQALMRLHNYGCSTKILAKIGNSVRPFRELPGKGGLRAGNGL